MFSCVLKLRSGLAALAAAFTLAAMAASPQAQAYELTCFDAANQMCGEYTFGDQATLESFIGQCQSMGSEAAEGHVCPSGGSGCFHANGSTTVTTWVYGMDAATVEQSCTANGGQVR